MSIGVLIRPTVTILLALPLVVLAACSGDDDDTGADSTPEPTEPAVEVPAYPDDKRTGEAALDAVIDAVLGGTAADLFAPARVTCDMTTESGMGTPPPCEGDESPGTVVEVLPVAGCDENTYVRGAALDELAGQLASNNPKLYAAYVPDTTNNFPAFPTGDFVAVFINDLGEGFAAHTTAGEILRVGLSCGTDLANLLDLAETELLPPLG